MIAILTLFLGLYAGPQTVQLAVDDAVAEVEVRLDGVEVGRLEEPPWVLRVDLGDDLEPHELTALARDAGGAEIGRARRWINLETAPAATDGAGGPPDPAPRTAVAVTLGPGVELPPVAQMQTWFASGGEALEVLRVDEGRAEVVIVRDPVVQPFLEQAASLFFAVQPDGLDPQELAAPLADKEAFVAAAREVLRDRRAPAAPRNLDAVWERWNDHLGLGDDVDVSFLSPRAPPVSRIASRKQIFTFARQRRAHESGLLWHATAVRPLRFYPRISDAVAMAGLEARAGHRRRAVLALLSDAAAGPNRHPPAAVCSYLEKVQVPLFVWVFSSEKDRKTLPPGGVSPGPPDWGEARTFTSPGRPAAAGRRRSLSPVQAQAYLRQLEAAARELRQQLGRQRIVWLRGAHLPSRIRLVGGVEGVELAGGPRWSNS